MINVGEKAIEVIISRLDSKGPHGWIGYLIWP